MTEKKITLAESFRTILRAGYPSRPALADEIQSPRYFHSALWCHCRLRRIEPEAQAADEAMATLKDGITSGSVRLRGRRRDRDWAADIDPTEIRGSGIFVFDNALDVWQSTTRVSEFRKLPIYLNVHCYAADIEALIGGAENDAAEIAPLPSVAAMTKSGVRMKTQADAETACANFIKGLPKEPRIIKEDLENLALKMFQGLSGKAFGRQWRLHIHSEWTAQGAPRKPPRQ
jgi:hypothetical protein